MKTKAYQLYTTATTPIYIGTLLENSTFSTKLEHVCNPLQEVNINVKAIHDHLTKWTDVLQSHRENASIDVKLSVLEGWQGKTNQSSEISDGWLEYGIGRIFKNIYLQPIFGINNFFCEKWISFNTQKSIFFMQLQSLTEKPLQTK